MRYAEFPMQDVIRTAIREALNELGIGPIDFVVEHPAERAHGDYASNVAMVAAKAAGKDPRELAEEIAAKLQNRIETANRDGVRGASEGDEGVVSGSTVTEEPSDETKKFALFVASIEVAGQGFVNFKLNRDFFSHEIARAREAGAGWGTSRSLEGETVVVEYTDPNPFKEFHIGHLFTNSVGEAIARLFMMGGATVKCVNYQGDVGVHVACAIYGMQELGFAGARDFSAAELGNAYALGAKAYKEDEDAQQRIKTINRAIYERSDLVINELYDKGREVSLAYFEDIYALLGTHFEHYFFESEAAPRGKELVLQNPDVFPESDGARVFLGEEHGLHTRVFVNSEGLPTYEAKELALAKMKEEALGAYDRSVIVTANEINEYFKVLLAAMRHVYPELAEKTEHVGHGTVRLTSGKMSSRTGTVIAARDFIDEVADRAAEKMQESGVKAGDRELAREVALGAIKYATLRSSIFQDSVFDKEQALSFEGDSGPYLMYTHARICSVLKKASDEGIKPAVSNVPVEPYEVETLLYQFPEVIDKALAERQPHHVTVFLTELAGAFNTFYATERIADAEDEYAPYKTALSDAVRQTLKNGLELLAIAAPEEM